VSDGDITPIEFPLYDIDPALIAQLVERAQIIGKLGAACFM
jgi:hypothetical protein